MVVSDSYLWLAHKSLCAPCLQFSIANFTFNKCISLINYQTKCYYGIFHSIMPNEQVFMSSVLLCTKLPSEITSIHIHELIKNIIILAFKPMAKRNALKWIYEVNSTPIRFCGKQMPQSLFRRCQLCHVTAFLLILKAGITKPTNWFPKRDV